MTDAPVPDRLTMSRGFKVSLAIAIYPTFVLAVLVFVLASSGFFDDGKHEMLRHASLVLGGAAAVAGALAVIYGFVWVIRHLRGNAQVGWALAFVFGASVTALVWWWRFIRPLPEPS